MPKKILLADDSVTIQKVVELTFMEGDYEVTCVSNGKAAVQKLQEARPDILLCDVIMPEMNGYEVAAFVKKNPAFSSIPVILLTGTFEPFDEEKARGSGADTYITKPFDSRLLIEKVEELISRRAAMQVAPASGEAVKIFQSRQEFTLGALPEAPRVEPSVLPGPRQPGADAFMTEEPEFMMPSEEVGMATVRVLTKPPEAPTPAEEPQAPPAPKQEDESPFMAPSHEEAAKPAAPPALPLTETPAQTHPPVMEMPEAVDLGPMKPEDAIPEAAFSDVVAPAHEFLPEPGEVVLTPDAVAKPEEVPAPPEIESGTVSVGGAEDWGAPEKPASEAAVEAEEKWAVFETGTKEAEPEPEIIHSMADQQEMVSEAQAVLDQQQHLEHGAPEARTPFEEESIAAAVEEYAAPVPEAVEAEATEEAPSPPPYEEVPEQEVPYLPEEGVETGLPEIIEPVPPSPSVQVLEPEATLEREVVPELHAEAPVKHVSIEEAAVEEPPTLDQPSLDEPVPPAPEIEAGELPVMAVLPPLRPEMDRSQLEAMVRSLVEEMAPRLIREAAAAMSPEIVRQVASEAVPEEARKAAAALVPEHARQAVAQAVPGHVAELAQAALPAAIRAAAEPMIPEIVRQVADEKAAEIIRQVAESTAPALVAEAVKSALPEMVAKEIREMAQSIIRDVAWEVIPELAESLIKRRIQELESEVG